MITKFQQMSDFYKGLLYCVAGIVMLLYALGVIGKGITFIIVGFAVYLIVMGCIKLGLHQKLNNLLRHRR